MAKETPKIIRVRITGIEDAVETGRKNWGRVSSPWYRNKIGETYTVIDRGDHYMLAREPVGGMPPGHSCCGNWHICKGDAVVVA